nr:NADH dehydrogenase subunit 5 [Dipseliopoda setosa]
MVFNKIYKLMMMMSVLLFMVSMVFLMNNYSLMIEYQFYYMSSVNYVMMIYFDWMMLIFISFVLMISSLVMNYSLEYMFMDDNSSRFFMLVLMFVISMILMIMSPNLISILLGWDGLGFVSYCLVIYFQNYKSYSAGMLTILSNRIGDISLLFAIVFMMNYGSFNFMIYNEYMYEKNMLFIMFLVMIASITKSAQIPFSSWLPSAMAAPTPVSALVHSSTLVTAGVYLLIRFNFMFNNEYLSVILLIISSLTMLISGLSANFEFDLKKIIALSTLSQLSLMMVILSLGKYEMAFFHLLTHALFKALMFLCAGIIIHNLMGNQDIRKMGGLIKLMPLECSCLIISNLVLCGMPFLAGFYSKDLILESMMMMNINKISFVIIIISTGLTIMYSVRLMIYLMVMNYNFYSYIIISVNMKKMNFSMIMMLILSIFMGSMLMWLIFTVPNVVILGLFYKNMLSFILVFGMFIGYFINSMSISMFNMYNYKMFMGMMWFLPEIFLSMNKMMLNSGLKYMKLLDYGWSEYYGSMNMCKMLMNISSKFQLFHNNLLKIFMMSLYFWLLFLLMYFMII